jgi:two-component system NtrC family sensor kinase
VYLADETLNKLKEQNQVILRDHRKGQALELVAYTKIVSKKGLLAGYLEEILPFDQAAMINLKNRFRLEIMLFDPEGKITVASQPDFMLYPDDHFKNLIGEQKMGFFDLLVRDEPYGFIVRPLPNSDNQILVSLGASKKDVKTVLRRITIALVSVCSLVILLIIPTLLGISKMILRPLDYLVQAAHRIEEGEAVSKIPVESTTELAVLTETFNRMSQRVTSARKDLEKKVKELEYTNKELQSTQAQLVHTSKMVSLGQLVAGIAHELNNPIGFIYANMTHLKDYGDRLIQMVKVAETDPDKLKKTKEELEFDYIVSDMPKLIRSCEDGARRTRDIVVGLRDFSRLDEAQVKEIDLEESIRNTLGLLTGEIKTRIDVKTEFGKIPPVRCHASQINQVLMNILTNATQAIPDKGTIWIQTKEADHNYVQVSIRDSGQGINQQNLEKIFDPFFTTKPIGQGTGLGLSISYGIVKKHGGDIDVNSEPGKGTEFIITLPIDGEGIAA